MGHHVRYRARPRGNRKLWGSRLRVVTLWLRALPQTRLMPKLPQRDPVDLRVHPVGRSGAPQGVKGPHASATLAGPPGPPGPRGPASDLGYPTPTASDSSLEVRLGLDVGKTIGDRYQVLKVIGEGGMGVVYEAWDTQVSRKVAIKVVRSGVDGKYLSRFRREVEVTSQLRHPSTIRVFEHGQTADGRLYMVMERLTGRSLAERLEEGPLEEPEGLRIAQAVAESLSEAHEHGIFHRDLKPDNIFIETVGVSKVVKVLDFGIAGGVDATRLTHAGEVFGTPQYMSPEQCSGQRPDHRTDIYSLACILHEMLEGRPPFTADTPMATMLKHVRARVPRMRRASREAARVVLMGLRKDRTKRIQTAGRFAQLLGDCISGTATAGTSSPSYDDPFDLEERLVTPEPAASSLTPMIEESGRIPTTERRGKIVAVGLGVAFLSSIGGMIFGNLGSVAPRDGETTEISNPSSEASERHPLNRALVQTAVEGAHVFVDGVEQGQTPCWIKVPVGDETPHRIRVTKPGYVDVTMQWTPNTVTEPLPPLPEMRKLE